MLVYRMEMEDKQGPYTGNYEFYPAMISRHSNTDVWPDISEDTGGAFVRDRDLCGCSSLEKLLEWFDGFVEEILDEGGRILMYEVPDCYIWHTSSTKQLGFRKDKAEFVGVVNLDLVST